GGRGHFVGYGDLRRLQGTAPRIERASKVDDGGDAGAAQRDVDHAPPPGPAEGVGHHDGHPTPGAGDQGVADVAGRAGGVDGQQGGGTLVDVGQVDPGVGADEALARLADDQFVAPPQDPHRLTFDQLPAGILVGHGLQAVLGLGHDLLGDDDDVAVLEVDP